ncbi:MAG: MFS transporter [Betaproteobacteria bacterium]|nr:MFS transporter [Betaproteobacteria bacterium]
MTPFELRSSLGAASIFGLRMFGMFVILPIFALYADHLPGGDDHTLVGIALGAYGLTQAILQIPFGWLSDRWGRKRTIYMGLAIFAVGSFVAAEAVTIHGVILGRVIQGAGAISAAVIALTADLTRDEVRTKAMAIIGITIGVTFGASMVAGPVLSHWIGVPGIFALTGVLALAATGMVRFAIPDPPGTVPAANAERPRFSQVLRDRHLLRLNAGIFFLHATLMAIFVVVPFLLRDAGMPAGQQWKIYLPVMVLAFLLMVPLVVYSEKRQKQKGAFVASVLVLGCALLLLAVFGSSLIGLGLGLLVFFQAFNFLEASLPSLISRTAPAEAKGTAVGVYSSVQFLGTFAGATGGGWLSQHFGSVAVFAFCGVLVMIWFVVALGMSVPVTRTYPVPPMDEGRARGLLERLRSLPGVREVRLSAAGESAQLKVDTAVFDEDNAMRLISKEA